MSGPWACDECLRGAWLVRALSPRIEGALGGRHGGRARELLSLEDETLALAVDRRGAPELLERRRRADPARLRLAVRAARAWACCRHDGAYPGSLVALGDAPRVLFGRGDPSLLARLDAEPSVTVVGSRRPSAYGREVAAWLGREVAQARLPVVSGMALGIDSCAHEGALGAGGATVAVLGSGPDVPHPARKRELYERIAASGLILSELPPGTPPRRWTFPARNRIMAALSGMTVVVEARLRSGSLITAEIATDLGRDVGAVPGRIGSSAAAGTNDLLRDGAHLIRGGQDVLDALLGPGGADRIEAAVAASLPPELAAVLEEVEGGAESADAVARACGLSAAAAIGALARLELEGVIACDAAGRYRRTADPARIGAGSRPGGQ